MNGKELLASLLLFFVIGILVLQGVFLFAIYLSSEMHSFATYLVQEGVWQLPYFGIAYILLATSLLLVQWRLQAKRSIHLTMECDRATIEKQVIEEYVLKYFQKLFPQADPVEKVHLKKNNTIEIVLESQEIPLDEKEALFSKVRLELGSALATKIGYTKPFELALIER